MCERERKIIEDDKGKKIIYSRKRKLELLMVLKARSTTDL